MRYINDNFQAFEFADHLQRLIGVRPAHLGGAGAGCHPGIYHVDVDGQEHATGSARPGVVDRLVDDGTVELVTVQRDLPYTDDSTAHYWALHVPA